MSAINVDLSCPAESTWQAGSAARKSQSHRPAQKRQHTIEKLPKNRVKIDGYEFNLNEPPELHKFREEAARALRNLPRKQQAPAFAVIVTTDMYGLETDFCWERMEAASIAFAPKYKMPVTSVGSLKRHVPGFTWVELKLVPYERHRRTKRTDWWNAPAGNTFIHQMKFDEEAFLKWARAATAEREGGLAARKARRAELEHQRYERRKAERETAAASVIPHESEPVTEPVTEPRVVLRTANPYGGNRSIGATCHHGAGSPSPSGESSIGQSEVPVGQLRVTISQEQVVQKSDLDLVVQRTRDRLETISKHFNYHLDDRGLYSAISKTEASRFAQFLDEGPLFRKFMDAVLGRPEHLQGGYFVSKLPGWVDIMEIQLQKRAREEADEKVRASRRAEFKARASEFKKLREQLKSTGMDSYWLDVQLAEWHNLSVSEILDVKLPALMAKRTAVILDEQVRADQHQAVIEKWTARLPGTMDRDEAHTAPIVFIQRDLDSDQLIRGPLMYYEPVPNRRPRRGDVIRWMTQDELAKLYEEREPVVA